MIDIHDDKQITTWIGGTLKAMDTSMPIKDTTCPHCRVAIRYPLIARQSDIDLFATMLRSMQRVADDYGITANLLAEIRAKCMLEIARGQQSCS